MLKNKKGLRQKDSTKLKERVYQIKRPGLTPQQLDLDNLKTCKLSQE